MIYFYFFYYYYFTFLSHLNYFTFVGYWQVILYIWTAVYFHYMKHHIIQRVKVWDVNIPVKHQHSLLHFPFTLSHINSHCECDIAQSAFFTRDQREDKSYSISHSLEWICSPLRTEWFHPGDFNVKTRWEALMKRGRGGEKEGGKTIEWETRKPAMRGQRPLWIIYICIHTAICSHPHGHVMCRVKIQRIQMLIMWSTFCSTMTKTHLLKHDKSVTLLTKTSEHFFVKCLCLFMETRPGLFN